DAELQSAQFLDHGERHREREPGLLTAREHGEAAFARVYAEAVAIGNPFQFHRLLADLIEYLLGAPSNAAANMLAHQRSGFLNDLAGFLSGIHGGLELADFEFEPFPLRRGCLPFGIAP